MNAVRKMPENFMLLIDMENEVNMVPCLTLVVVLGIDVWLVGRLGKGFGLARWMDDGCRWNLIARSCESLDC